MLQYNAFIIYLKKKNFGVDASYLSEYEKFVAMFSDFLWNIDAHYDKLVSRSLSFSDSTLGLLGFNNPKKHKHSVGKFEPASFQNQMSKIVIILERRFMKSSHLKPFCKLVATWYFSDSHKVIEYLFAQKDKMWEHQQPERTDTEVPIDLYIIHKLKQFEGRNDNFSTFRFRYHRCVLSK